MNKHLLQRIDTYVTKLFREQVKPELVYHSLAHTQSVVKAAEHLASHYQLNETQYFTVLTAAWFHDTGYLLAAPAKHEEKGAELAAAFLTENGVSAAIITTVRACILATKLPQSPANLLEQIVCDADLFHLGGDDFKERTKLLRKEMEQLTGQSISGGEWRLKTLNFCNRISISRITPASARKRGRLITCVATGKTSRKRTGNAAGRRKPTR